MSKCLKTAERNAVLIVFNDVLYHVRAYTVAFFSSLYMNRVAEKLYCGQ